MECRTLRIASRKVMLVDWILFPKPTSGLYSSNFHYIQSALDHDIWSSQTFLEYLPNCFQREIINIIKYRLLILRTSIILLLRTSSI